MADDDFEWVLAGARQQQAWGAAVERLLSDHRDALRDALGAMQAYKAFRENKVEYRSGAALFDAYLSYRSLVKEAEAQSSAHLMESLRHGTQMEPAAYVAALTEKLRVEIFDALDGVIRGLAEFCASPVEKHKLSALRGALQIEGARSRYNADLRRKRERAAFLWVQAYCLAAKTGRRRSRKDIGAEIARTLGISAKTARGCDPAPDELLDQAKAPVAPPSARRIGKRRDFKFGLKIK